jgi:hypothetical protein
MSEFNYVTHYYAYLGREETNRHVRILEQELGTVENPSYVDSHPSFSERQLLTAEEGLVLDNQS